MVSVPESPICRGPSHARPPAWRRYVWIALNNMGVGLACQTSWAQQMRQRVPGWLQNWQPRLVLSTCQICVPDLGSKWFEDMVFFSFGTMLKLLQIVGFLFGFHLIETGALVLELRGTMVFPTPSCFLTSNLGCRGIKNWLEFKSTGVLS